MNPTKDHLRHYADRNGIDYVRLLETLVERSGLATDEALEAARRAVREADRFEIAEPEPD